MSERRTYTLDDRAVDRLKVVPKDRNSQFVSDLIVSFFEGKDLLSDSRWRFLSSEVEDVEEDDESESDSSLPEVEDVEEDDESESDSSLPGVVSESSHPVDLEKARLRGVLSKLESLDFSGYQAFSDFLALPEVRVGGMFDWTLGRLYDESGDYVEGGSGVVWKYWKGWDFVDLIPSSDIENRSSDTVEFYLKQEVSKLKSDFDFKPFLRGLFKVVSPGVLRDLFYQERFGLTYSEYIKRRKEEGEAKKKAEAEKKRVEAEKKKAEDESRRALESPKGKADFISSVEADLRGRLLKGGCSGSSVFSRCRGKLGAGYRIDPDSWVSYSGGFKADVDYTVVLCEKHLSKFSSGEARQRYTFVWRE